MIFKLYFLSHKHQFEMPQNDKHAKKNDMGTYIGHHIVASPNQPRHSVVFQPEEFSVAPHLNA